MNAIINIVINIITSDAEKQPPTAEQPKKADDDVGLD